MYAFEGDGMTGFTLPPESHLTGHTFPERGFAALDLYHGGANCRWPWDVEPAERFGAERGSTRTIRRDEAAGAALERLHAAQAAPRPT